MSFPLYLNKRYMEMLAKKTLPSAIITAGCPTYLAKRPERPKRTTAMWISMRLLVLFFIEMDLFKEGSRVEVLTAPGNAEM